MPKSSNQKLKQLYLLKILSEETDEQHGLTLSQITEKLKGYDISADRKTLYDDFEDLRLYGADIEGEKTGKHYEYRLLSRDFELSELKIIVDAVQSAKFITEKKSEDLLKKLESLTSKYEAKRLRRQVYTTGRVKAANESILYNIDALHEAINDDRSITFRYFSWNEKKQQFLHHDGEIYHVSPWALIWDSEYYYLIAFDESIGKIRHYRVDKMLNIVLTDQERQGSDIFQNHDIGRYTKSLFHVYSGEIVNVKLECENRMANVIIDRFGTDVMLIPEGKDRFHVTVEAALSPQFFGWLMALGTGVRLIGPDEAVDQMTKTIDDLKKLYENE